MNENHTQSDDSICPKPLKFEFEDRCIEIVAKLADLNTWEIKIMEGSREVGGVRSNIPDSNVAELLIAKNYNFLEKRMNEIRDEILSGRMPIAPQKSSLVGRV